MIEGGRTSRRRGEKLEEAIFEAVLAELGDGGVARLTFEGVAARARTGKSALYRRWPNKTELVLDALNAHALHYSDFVPKGELRQDLLDFLEHMTTGHEGPAGIALRNLIGEAHHSPELFDALLVRFLDPRENALAELLHDMAERGQIDESVVTRDVVNVLPALVMQHYLLNRGPITPAVIAAMVDKVFLPLIKSDGLDDGARRARLHRVET